MHPISPLSAELAFLWEQINLLRATLKLPPLTQADVAAAIEAARSSAKLPTVS